MGSTFSQKSSITSPKTIMPYLICAHHRIAKCAHLGFTLQIESTISSQKCPDCSGCSLLG